MIVLSDIATGSVTDLLNDTRLQSVPRNGRMTIQLLADNNDATNNFTCTIQLPDGDTPINGIKVPSSNPSLAGVLDERQLFQASYNIAQGGHVTISFTETGTAILAYRIIFR